MAARFLHKTGSRVDVARCADREEQIAIGEGCEDFIHLIRHFAKPDDVGAEAARFAAGGASHCRGEVRLAIGFAAAEMAKGFQDFAVHMYEVFRPGAFVEVVDILGDDEDGAGPFLFQMREGQVRGIGFDGRVEQAPAAHIVKFMDEGGVAGKGFGCGDVFNFMAAPKTACASECLKAAFGRDSGAGQDDDGGCG